MPVQAKKVLGMTGLPVLCNVLRSEREDKEMVRGSLECLNQLVAPAKVRPPASPCTTELLPIARQGWKQEITWKRELDPQGSATSS